GIRYRYLTIMDLTSKLSGTVVSIGLAIAYRSVWALVAGQIAGAFCRLILSHLLLPGQRMRFVCNRQYVRELLTRGKWISMNSTLGLMVTLADKLVIGGLYSSHVLGVYSLAYQLFEACLTLVRRVHLELGLALFGELLKRGPANFVNKFYQYRFPTDF